MTRKAKFILGCCCFSAALLGMLRRSPFVQTTSSKSTPTGLSHRPRHTIPEEVQLSDQHAHHLRGL